MQAVAAELTGYAGKFLAYGYVSWGNPNQL
jgi:hypothetical protein